MIVEDGEKMEKNVMGKRDQIITWGSPTATFRWDDVLVDFRNLSVREIQPPLISDLISNVKSNNNHFLLK